MSLHLRKMMQDQIELAQSKRDFSTPDKYEEWVLDAMTETDPNEALGSLTVICADLLEQVRRSDPAYGLTAIHVPFGSHDPADRGQSRGDELNGA